jgi:hypothetical protein
LKGFDYRVGPGPNSFSDDTPNVWVDSLGRLHMKIDKKKGKWRCAEVICRNHWVMERIVSTWILTSPVWT